AYHYEKAEAPEKAIRYLTRAAERAAATYANTEALTFYRSALEQVSRARQTGTLPAAECDGIAARLHEGLGDVLELIGHHDEARAACEDALALVPSAARVHRADLHRKAGLTHTGQFQYDEALAAYARAEATLGGEPAEEDAAGWREWAQIQIARLSV